MTKNGRKRRTKKQKIAAQKRREAAERDLDTRIAENDVVSGSAQEQLPCLVSRQEERRDYLAPVRRLYESGARLVKRLGRSTTNTRKGMYAKKEKPDTRPYKQQFSEGYHKGEQDSENKMSLGEKVGISVVIAAVAATVISGIYQSYKKYERVCRPFKDEIAVFKELSYKEQDAVEVLPFPKECKPSRYRGGLL